MQGTYEIKNTADITSYLIANGRTEPYDDYDYQLPGNYGWVYELANGKVVFVANSFSRGGIIFRDKKIFKQIADSEKFPVENPEKSLYDTEIERIKTINTQIDFYRNHLNTVLKFDFPEVNREAAQAYIKKIVGRTIKKLTTNTDLVALIAVFGEIIRREIKGKWMLEKWYGTYNPYYMPRILNPKKMIIHVNDNVLLAIKWKVAHSDRLLDDTEGILSIKEVRKHHQCIVL